MRTSLHGGSAFGNAGKHLKSFPPRSSRHAVSASTHPKEPIATPSPRVQPGPEEGFEPETKSDTASVPPEGSEPVSLWDEAYVLLKKEKPDLMSDYESLLSRVAAEGMYQPIGSGPPGKSVLIPLDKMRTMAKIRSPNMMSQLVDGSYSRSLSSALKRCKRENSTRHFLERKLCCKKQ